MYQQQSSSRKEDRLKQTIRELERLLNQLRRFGIRDEQTIDQQIVSALHDCGPLSTGALRSLLRRSRITVVATVRLLEAAGKIRRNESGKQWEVVNGQ